MEVRFVRAIEPTALSARRSASLVEHDVMELLSFSREGALTQREEMKNHRPAQSESGSSGRMSRILAGIARASQFPELREKSVPKRRGVKMLPRQIARTTEAVNSLMSICGREHRKARCQFEDLMPVDRPLRTIQRSSRQIE
ncbi:hypothetical protein EJI01_27670 [Variovorax sp. MHTC-1]|nr:hypothetical protein EJI01_27670 [Variovorax sp. MHTC-1]